VIGNPVFFGRTPASFFSGFQNYNRLSHRSAVRETRLSSLLAETDGKIAHSNGFVLSEGT
jgi:hypothetical protein